MAAGQREGPFWDALEGRTPGPPSARLLGSKLLAVDPEQGTITLQFEAREEFVNGIGAIQGGFLMAMLDETLGCALVAMLPPDEAAPTIEIKASFTRPARVGLLVGEARVVHRGRSIGFIEGTLRDLDGKLIATASATASIRPRAVALARHAPHTSPGDAADLSMA